MQISAPGESYIDIGDPIDRHDSSCKTPCWRLHTVDLTDYVGQTVKIGFLATGQDGFDFYLDDITYAPPGYPCPAIVANPPHQTLGACPGNSINSDLEFWNDTSEAESLTIATDAAWPVSINPSSVTLQPGAAQKLNIAVSIPWTAEFGAEEAANVTAQAGLSGVQGSGHFDLTAYLIGGYQETAPPYTVSPSLGASMVYYDGHLYRNGGRDLGTLLDLDIYSISSNAWYSGAALPESRISIDCVEIDGLIYCAGGIPGMMNGILNTMDIYNPDTNTWQSGPDMPGGLAGYAGTVLNGEYYLIGGSDSGRVPVNYVYIYNPSSGWRTDPPLQSARIYPAAGTIDGKIYVAGGIGLPGSGDSVLNSVEVFDPQTGTWSAAAPMPGGGTAGSAYAVVNNRYLIVAGGQEYYLGTEQYSNRVLLYDTVNPTWTNQTELSSPMMLAEGDSDGSTMWIGSGFRLDETGSIVQQAFLYRSITCARYPPTLVVNPSKLEIQLAPDTKRVVPILFENTGDLNLEWELEEKSPLNWLSVDPIDGLINSQAVSIVNFTFDATGLDQGEYMGMLEVTSNDPIHPLIEIPVTLKVDDFNIYLPAITQ